MKYLRQIAFDSDRDPTQTQSRRLSNAEDFKKLGFTVSGTVGEVAGIWGEGGMK